MEKGMSRRDEKGGNHITCFTCFSCPMSHTNFACECCICKASGQRAADYAKAIGLRMGKLEGTFVSMSRKKVQTQILQSNDLTFMINDEASLGEVNRELCELHTTQGFT